MILNDKCEIFMPIFCLLYGYFPSWPIHKSEKKLGMHKSEINLAELQYSSALKLVSSKPPYWS